MGYGSEKILPYNENENKGTQVKRMFDEIAPTYDPLNRIISLGLDKGWRRKGIAFLKPFSPQKILDITTGTGDLAISMAKKLRPEQITGADLSEEMMKIGRRKAEEAGYGKVITFEQQDCTALTYPDNSFDAVTAAFGVRNFEQIETGLAEMYRVIKPGGHIMILELSAPGYFPMKQLYTLYTTTILPLVGQLISRQKTAYKYLPESIRVVPQGQVMAGILRKCGFTEVKIRTFTFGVCSLYTGKK
ncbi:MAG: bifunctional demethylmenaquinone methyltransferase/2-methoxy-6-polyprenyl-1,4-benzoquinol methylase UbiE [Tannerellaceae bacterium]|nr:bifunctional demethylmenaquinone methyltransferase/2-methoxy-6-polyprenyl-1,4-benzoquinol methylase UbiE [Tannerellaceae bacterium]MCD8264469.1 bifunctional demethylmenaquinone methyltransferase/2-methoxy-6-polyprenyl-1,4-benzoquinol methylase UbiE [Tannerellaceae bacterium]